MKFHRADMSKKHNIGYIRFSSVDQDMAQQLEGINLNKTFIDKCSGKDTNRPQLKLMLDFVQEGDTLYVHSMDKLARNLGDLRKIINDLANKGVEVKFVKEGLTFNSKDSSIANFMLSVIEGFADFERALIKERQREGIEQAKKEGKYRGRSKCLSDEQISQIRQLVADRYKKTEIAKKFGIGRDTLYRYLRTFEKSE